MICLRNTIWTLAGYRRWLGYPGSGQLALASLGITLVVFGSSPVQAGMLSPLLQLGRPTLEAGIRQHCETLADQHLGSVLKAQWQPLCQTGAQKISTCLLEQASRQGKEWALMQEGIKGKPGAVTQSLLLACAGQMLGLDARPDAPAARQPGPSQLRQDPIPLLRGSSHPAGETPRLPLESAVD